jgi:hypothetical protein
VNTPMRTFGPVFLCAIILLSCIPVYEVEAESVEVCCDSSPIELFLIGPAASGGMTPFVSELTSGSGLSIRHGLVVILNQHGSFLSIMKLRMQGVPKLMPQLELILVAKHILDIPTNPIHFFQLALINWLST